MEYITFLSKGEAYILKNNNLEKLSCEAINKYKLNLKEIKDKRKWKKDLEENQMSSLLKNFSIENDDKAIIEGIKILNNNKIIYTSNLGNTCAIYSKLEDIEDLILRSKDFVVHEFDFDDSNNKIISSAGIGDRSKNLLLIDPNTKDYDFLTEGECIDSNPHFDVSNRNIVYYDSCGIGYSSKGQYIGKSNRTINKLDMSLGDVEEIIANEKFDFIKPKIDKEGNLYYIKLPGKSSSKLSFAEILKNIFLMPVKVLKAVFGWLDFFTQRYSGETLRTKGNNPAKTKEKTEEELFVEGNLINVQKNLEESIKSNDKFPGVIPKSWELIKNKNGNETVIKKGVLDFEIDDTGKIIYSNGKSILIIKESLEEKICDCDLATNISFIK